MKLNRCFLLCVAAITATLANYSVLPAQNIDELIQSGTLILEDDFDREELGNQWKNNDGRAQRTSKIAENEFVTQANITDGTLQVRRTEGSDHAATAKQNVQFQDAVIKLRFRLTGKNKFSVNTNDPGIKETVHAGHVFKVEIGTSHVLIQDQLNGTMDLKNREVRQSDDADAKKALNKKLAKFQQKTEASIEADQWHDLTILVRGETIHVHVDGSAVTEFASPGIGHTMKENIAFSVPKGLDADDFKVWSLPPGEE